MDILLLDALVPEATTWLETRHSVEYRPELADDLVALRKVAYKTKAVVFPRHSVVTRDFLDFLPKLKAVARLHVGTDNTDLQACLERDIKVIHASSANVRSNAEYLLSTLLLLYRRCIALTMSSCDLYKARSPRPSQPIAIMFSSRKVGHSEACLPAPRTHVLCVLAAYGGA